MHFMKDDKIDNGQHSTLSHEDYVFFNSKKLNFIQAASPYDELTPLHPNRYSFPSSSPGIF